MDYDSLMRDIRSACRQSEQSKVKDWNMRYFAKAYGEMALHDYASLERLELMTRIGHALRYFERTVVVIQNLWTSSDISATGYLQNSSGAGALTIPTANQLLYTEDGTPNGAFAWRIFPPYNIDLWLEYSYMFLADQDAAVDLDLKIYDGTPLLLDVIHTCSLDNTYECSLTDGEALMVPHGGIPIPSDGYLLWGSQAEIDASTTAKLIPVFSARVRQRAEY